MPFPNPKPGVVLATGMTVTVRNWDDSTSTLRLLHVDPVKDLVIEEDIYTGQRYRGSLAVMTHEVITIHQPN